MMTKHITSFLLMASVAATSMLLTGCLASSGPTVDDSETSRKLESLPRPKNRKTVTIYEFSGGVRGFGGRAATDMFTTALVKSGRFKVVERQRLGNVMREKALSSSGASSGKSAAYKLKGADYIFEGSITESNSSKSGGGVSASYKGLGGSTGGKTGSIGLDIRVIDANDGSVLDAINVRKEIKSSSSSVSGVGRFLSNITGKNLGGDVSARSHENEGIDEAVRACIEESIYQIAKRYQ